jgi:hypothetical protein
MLKTLRFSVRLPSFLLCVLLSYYVVLFCKQTCKKLSSKLLLYFPFTGLISAIYGPVIYTAPHVMLLMRATSITRASGKVEIETFLGLVKWHRAVRRVPSGAQKSRSLLQSVADGVRGLPGMLEFCSGSDGSGSAGTFRKQLPVISSNI